MPTRNRTKKKKTSPTNRARAAADLTRLCKNIKTTRSGFARAEEMVEAKRLYEAVHPETRRGAAPGKAGGGKSKNATVASFVRFMAKETGLSARAITYDVQIATKLVSAAKDRVRGTDLANRTAALIALSELAERQQLAVMKTYAKDGFVGARKILRKLTGKAQPTAHEPATVSAEVPLGAVVEMLLGKKRILVSLLAISDGVASVTLKEVWGHPDAPLPDGDVVADVVQPAPSLDAVADVDETGDSTAIAEAEEPNPDTSEGPTAPGPEIRIPSWEYLNSLADVEPAAEERAVSGIGDAEGRAKELADGRGIADLMRLLRLPVAERGRELSKLGIRNVHGTEVRSKSRRPKRAGRLVILTYGEQRDYEDPQDLQRLVIGHFDDAGRTLHEKGYVVVVGERCVAVEAPLPVDEPLSVWLLDPAIIIERHEAA